MVPFFIVTWWRHQMETPSALLAICAGIHRSPVNSSYKGQWCGAVMFPLICVWIDGWVWINGNVSTAVLEEQLTNTKSQRGSISHYNYWFVTTAKTMASSNRNIFRVTGLLCGEFTGAFPAQRHVRRSFDVFFDDWDAIMPIMTSLQ